MAAGSGRALGAGARRAGKGAVGAGGRRPGVGAGRDSAEDVPYGGPADGSSDGMWVPRRHQPLQRLGDASFLLGELRNKRIERSRLIFPVEFRDEVVAAMHRVLD